MHSDPLLTRYSYAPSAPYKHVPTVKLTMQSSAQIFLKSTRPFANGGNVLAVFFRFEPTNVETLD